MSDDCTHGHPDGSGYPCTACLDERIASLETQRDNLKLQNRLLQELVAEFVEGGEIDPHEEDPKCPQDDTCECKRAKKLNDALRGYEEKRNDKVGNPWAPNLDYPGKPPCVRCSYMGGGKVYKPCDQHAKAFRLQHQPCGQALCTICNDDGAGR